MCHRVRDDKGQAPGSQVARRPRRRGAREAEWTGGATTVTVKPHYVLRISAGFRTMCGTLPPQAEPPGRMDYGLRTWERFQKFEPPDLDRIRAE